MYYAFLLEYKQDNDSPFSIVGEQASMFSLNLSASCKPRQNHEVTLEETRKGQYNTRLSEP